MCMIEGCEPWEFYSDPVHTKARTPKKCQECHRTIEPGEYYYKGAAKADGRFHTIRHCAHCNVAVDWLGANCGGSVQEMVLEDIQEHADEYREIAFGLLRVAIGGRRDWRFKRGPKSGQLMPIPRMPPSIRDAMARRESFERAKACVK